MRDDGFIAVAYLELLQLRVLTPGTFFELHRLKDRSSILVVEKRIQRERDQRVGGPTSSTCLKVVEAPSLGTSG